MPVWTDAGMEPVLAVVAGVLTACAVYLMLSRNLVRFLFGLMLLSNGVNIVIFASGRLTLVAPPLIPDDALAPATTIANALPQALILTAIVIGFGLLSFVMVLVWRAYVSLGTVDTDAMRAAEPVDEHADEHTDAPVDAPAGHAPAQAPAPAVGS